MRKVARGARRKKGEEKARSPSAFFPPDLFTLKGSGDVLRVPGAAIRARSLVTYRLAALFFGGKSGAVYIESRDDDDVRAQSRYRICTMQRSFSDKREREDGCPTGCRLYRSLSLTVSD